MLRHANSAPEMTTPSFAASAVPTMPRTTEVLWNGESSLPFTLKRKRNGAILVTKMKDKPTPPRDLRLGSELKLVGGFPVGQLTLSEVKKVMLHAPKPVSLVFLNHDDVVLDNMSFLSEERGSFENEFTYEYQYEQAELYPPLRESSEWSYDIATRQLHSCSAPPMFHDHESLFDSSSSVFDSSRSVFRTMSSTRSTATESGLSSTRRRRRSPDAGSEPQPPRKVSRLKLALERMNQLLNRPVRRSGLNIAAGKSIVV